MKRRRERTEGERGTSVKIMEGGEVKREERRAEEELYHRATLALQTVSSQGDREDEMEDSFQ